MSGSQAEPPLAGFRTTVTENGKETGTPSSTNYDERADDPAVLAGGKGGTTLKHNRGENGASKAETPAILAWEGVTYR